MDFSVFYTTFLVFFSISEFQSSLFEEYNLGKDIVKTIYISFAFG